MGVVIMPFLEDLVERTGIVSINITEISSVKRGTAKVTIIIMHNGNKHEVYHPYANVMAWIKNYYKK